MNVKVVVSSQLSTMNLEKKNKNTKKLTNKQNRNRIIDVEIVWRAISWEGKGENGRSGSGNKKHNWQVQKRQGGVKK